MATKSKAAAAQETNEAVETKEAPVIAEEQEEVKSAWDEQVEMVVPRKPKGEETFYYICVNDRRFQVPADGKVQKLPKPVAEVLRSSLEAEADADDFADHIPNKTGPENAVI